MVLLDTSHPPTAERQPIVRRFTTEIGQSLNDQVFQTNENENDPRAGGGTCSGDSGRPSILDGYLVGDTSYGLTANCRYIGGYHRVDIPVVRNLGARLRCGPRLPDQGIVIPGKERRRPSRQPRRA